MKGIVIITLAIQTIGVELDTLNTVSHKEITWGDLVHQGIHDIEDNDIHKPTQRSVDEPAVETNDTEPVAEETTAVNDGKSGASALLSSTASLFIALYLVF